MITRSRPITQTSECANANDLVGLISVRVRELVEQRIDALRLLPPFSEGNEFATVYAARRETLGMSRARLIEAIVVEEFSEEFPMPFEKG